MPTGVPNEPDFLPRPKSYCIYVTRDIIDSSVPNDGARCMAAQAIRIQLGASSVDVSSEYIRFNMGEFRYCYPFPAHVGQKIAQFDKEDGGDNIRPFKFWLQRDAGFVARVVRRRSPNTKVRHVNLDNVCGCQNTNKNKDTSGVARRCSKRRYHGLKVVSQKTK